MGSVLTFLGLTHFEEMQHSQNLYPDKECRRLAWG